MTPKVGYGWLLLGLSLSGLPGGAQRSVPQKPAPQQTVSVVVVNAHYDPPQPVQAVRVSLSYVDGFSRISDARDVSNRNGEAWLQVSPDVSQRDDVRVEITGASDLVIYEPADGQLTGLPLHVTVKLLPKGSPALLGPVQIEAMLHRSLLRVNSLQRRNVALMSELAGAQNQKPNLSATLAEWAKSNGFATADVDTKVREWAEDIQRNSAEATKQQCALAELALKHYGNAAKLFAEAANADSAALDADEQKFLEVRRTKLRQLVQDEAQSASAFQLNRQYHLATQTLEAARERAAAEQMRYPEDTAFREISLDAGLELADAQTLEGWFSTAGDSLRLLAQGTGSYENLAKEYLSLGDRGHWASIQIGLGGALLGEGQRATEDESMALLGRAVLAFSSALEVDTRAALPEDWANTQTGLALALAEEGARSYGDKAMDLLGRAVQAYRSALEVNTRVDLPQDWARTQMNLGNTLEAEGERATEDKVMALLDQAVQAYRSALEVNTRVDLPQDWARTQMNLGNALSEEGSRASGDRGMALLDQAVQAYRSVLEVDTRADLPQDWANTQLNLGRALAVEGQSTTGDKSMALLDQAVQAFRSALEINTRVDLPQDWALTQIDLGGALADEGLRATGDKSIALLKQAVQAFRNALEIYSKTGLPEDWARTQMSLGTTLAYEEKRSTGNKGALFDQSVEAYQNALGVFTKAGQERSTAERLLGDMLDEESKVASGDRAAALHIQAEDAHRRAQEDQ
jgi:tetratricopeptide (TPR) repeat protein